MKQSQKAAALESMLKTAGWGVLNDYLTKNAIPEIVPAESLDALIKQAYKNGICQGHQDVLNFIKVTIATEKRKLKNQQNVSERSLIKLLDDLDTPT